MAPDAILIAREGRRRDAGAGRAVDQGSGHCSCRRSTTSSSTRKGEGRRDEKTRGAYVVDVKYRLDLVGNKLLTRDGAISWKTRVDGAARARGARRRARRLRLAVGADGAAPRRRRERSDDDARDAAPRAPSAIAMSSSSSVPTSRAATPSAGRRASIRRRFRTCPRRPELHRGRGRAPVEAAPPSLLASIIARVLVAVRICVAIAQAPIFAPIVLRVERRRRASRAAGAMRCRSYRAREPLVLEMPWRLSGRSPTASPPPARSRPSLLWWNPLAGAALGRRSRDGARGASRACADREAARSRRVAAGDRIASSWRRHPPELTAPLDADAFDLGTRWSGPHRVLRRSIAGQRSAPGVNSFLRAEDPADRARLTARRDRAPAAVRHRHARADPARGARSCRHAAPSRARRDRGPDRPRPRPEPLTTIGRVTARRSSTGLSAIG